MKDFPDLPHLRQLQHDLWSWPRSRAALMVGAGLSLNATPLPGVTSRFPTWKELVRFMFDELHPLSSKSTPDEERSREAQFAGEGALRIASEYEAAFGRRKLDLLIQKRNPDNDYCPGEIHRLLLQLPWVDVFTTNYDTLLERTSVPSKSYTPVITSRELTTAFPPRIIKLHGSLSTQGPYVITEEDYRTYRRRQAPFVNSVQQALIENSFVLLGFSGDDPNFLEWSGWIRDELGDKHAPIYLVGPLNLEPPKRALLIKRGVTPIDLAPVFAHHSPPQGIHEAATEWFLRSLAIAKNPRPEAWPEFKVSQPILVAGAPPLPRADFHEPDPIELSHRGSINIETFNKVIARWSFERNRYPGWLVLRESERQNLWDHTKFWVSPLITFALRLDPSDEIKICNEIVWRIETSMTPLIEEWADLLLSALDRFDSTLNENALHPSTTKIPVDRIHDWFGVAFCLLRDAREEYNDEKWQSIKGRINSKLASYPRFTDRLIYDSVLWALWNVDHSAARDMLSRWQVSGRNPQHAMWKASLLAELDELVEARELLRSALTTTREALRTKGNNIELLSMEGWCIYVLGIIETSLDFRSDVMIEYRERWQELKAWECSPWPRMEYFDTLLSKNAPRPHRSDVINRGFDLHDISASHSWRADILSQYLPAYACIRLYEKVGIPMRIHMIDISGESLARACKWIEPFSKFWSPALLIRGGKHKAFSQEELLDRCQVASMDATKTEWIYDWSIRIFDRHNSTFFVNTRSGTSAEDVLLALIEVISRVCIRVDKVRLNKTFELVMGFYRKPELMQFHTVRSLTGSLFRRLMESADEHMILEWLQQLLIFPIFSERNSQDGDGSREWSDPMRWFDSGSIAKIIPTEDQLSRISESVEWLFGQTIGLTGEARKRTIYRLIDVYHCGFMNEDQIVQLGRLLWETNRANKSFPDIKGFACFGFLHLPAPEAVDVRARIKTHILSLDLNYLVQPNSGNQKEIRLPAWHRHPLFDEGRLASQPLIKLRGGCNEGIIWTDEETKLLFERLMQWWDHEKASFAMIKPGGMFSSFTLDPIKSTLKIIGEFLARAILPRMGWADELAWKDLLGLLEEIREYEVYPTIAFPYILAHIPENLSQYSELIYEDLNSDIEDAVATAGKALRHWISLAAENLTPQPPPDLLISLVHRVAFRRNSGLLTCLQQVSYILEEQPAAFFPSEIAVLTASLNSWKSAIPFQHSGDNIFDFHDPRTPELRYLVASLASSLANWHKSRELDEPNSVSIWREACDADPLPEMRQIFG